MSARDMRDWDQSRTSRCSVIVPGGANRLIAVGHLANGVVVVVFGALGSEGVGIVSMRPASRKERKLLDG